MDALSETLASVRVTAAVFTNAEFTEPWGFMSPPAQQLIPVLSPATERMVIFHLITDGRARVRLEGFGEIDLQGGDILVVPHGDRHAVLNGSPAALIDAGAELAQYWMGDLSSPRMGGGGAPTRLVCGYFGFERHAEKMFLAGLPPLVTVNLRHDASGAWLESSIRHLVSETVSRTPGGAALLSKMAEALFIETLRRYAAQLPPEETGWLAGVRDPIVGAALAVMHRRPCEPWTVADLAREVGASRAVLAERFVQFLGEPPLTYLTRWRLLLAARNLKTSRATVLQVASDIGYESEAAFNRAFKREFGLPPAQYRRKASPGGTHAPPPSPAASVKPVAQAKADTPRPRA